jgi:cytochrome c oxidase assembly protein subunit 15
MERSNKIIGYWLMLGVGMLIVQIFLGGVTRLTGSGLSITEWKAVMGALPPMNEYDWQAAFEQYKQFDQYKLVNSTMTLPEFKYIFFWEYIHRLWARFMALCAFLPMLYFAYKKILQRQDILRIVLLIALGGLAGFVGWIMVASGLEENKVLVNPVKLMLHLLIASLIVSMTFRFALEYIYPKQPAFRSDSRKWLTAFLVLVVFQIGFGALMAGSKAAINATDWPLMNGSFFPPHVGFLQPWADHIHENNLMLQFLHRNMAYAITLFTFFLFAKLYASGTSPEFQFTRKLLLASVLFQVCIGIMTLFFTKGKVPVFWGELHQLGAFAVLLSAIALHYFARYRNA